MNGQNRWLYLIKRMVYRFFDDGIPQSAAELSYFLLFSMFPLLMFVNSMLAQLDLSIEGMQPVLEMLPKSLQQLIGGYIQQLTGTPSFSPMIVGLGLTLYFLSRAVRSMMPTLKSRAAWSRTCSFRSALRRVFLFRLCAALCSLSPDEPSSALYRNIYRCRRL